MSAPAWLAPTARSVRWAPLLVAAGGALVLLAVVAAVSERPPTGLAAALVLAAIVAAAVAAVADPAEELLRAMPTSMACRLARRAALVAVAAALCLAAVSAVGGAAFRPGWAAPGAAALAALAASGSAVLVLGVRAHRRAAGELAAGVVIGWAAVGALASQVGVDHAWAMTWWTWPLPVSAVAALAVSTRWLAADPAGIRGLCPRRARDRRRSRRR